MNDIDYVKRLREVAVDTDWPESDFYNWVAEEIESLTMAKERLREELMYARALLQNQYCDLTSIDKALEETE